MNCEWHKYKMNRVAAGVAWLILVAGPAAADQWTVQTYFSKIDDSPNVLATVQADEPAADRNGSPVEVTAILQCSEHRTGFWVHFGGFFMSNRIGSGNMIVRLDKMTAQEFSMSASTDNKALGLTGSRAIKLAKAMDGKTKLFVAATPVNEGLVQATFSLTGFQDAVAAVRKACGW